MKTGRGYGKAARPWLPIIIFVFSLLVIFAKVSSMGPVANEPVQPYNVEPTTTITAR